MYLYIGCLGRQSISGQHNGSIEWAREGRDCQVHPPNEGSIMAAYGGLEKEETDKFILLMRAA